MGKDVLESCQAFLSGHPPVLAVSGEEIVRLEDLSPGETFIHDVHINSTPPVAIASLRLSAQIPGIGGWNPGS
jgi:hypothetical protein